MTIDRAIAITAALTVAGLLFVGALAASYDADYGGRARAVWLYRAIGRDCSFSAYYPANATVYCRVWP